MIPSINSLKLINHKAFYMNPLVILAIVFNIFYINSLIAIDRFPAIAPNCTGMLQVDELHQIYWEESGNPNGVPVLFLHGGPGVGTEESYRTFFDPNFYRIILFDQRGCGKSLPYGCLKNNTTWDLVEDINKLREFLSIDRCLLFGGSWGSTLALTYAIKYPQNVSGLILRGVFLCRQQELDWFYKEGANHLSPKAWQIFIDSIPSEKRDDLIAAYHDKLHSDSYWSQIDTAAAWVLWEFANLQSVPDSCLSVLLNSKLLFYAFVILFANQNKIQAQIENHYFVNKCFFETDNWILENIHNIQHIPGIIIQGQFDRICPWGNAEELHLNWTTSTFLLIPNAGHASNEPGILEALIKATEEFKTKLLEDELHLSNF
jgi:proline iminopeptidase